MHHIILYLNTVKIPKNNFLREAHPHSHCLPEDPILSVSPHAFFKKKIYIHIFWTVKMAQQIKALVTRLDDLSWQDSPWNNSWMLSPNLHRCPYLCMHAHTRAHCTYTIMINKMHTLKMCFNDLTLPDHELSSCMKDLVSPEERVLQG